MAKKSAFDHKDPQLIADYLTGLKPPVQLARERNVSPAAITQWANKMRKADPTFIPGSLRDKIKDATYYELAERNLKFETDRVERGLKDVISAQVEINADRVFIHREQINTLMNDLARLRRKMSEEVETTKGGDHAKLCRLTFAYGSITDSVRKLIELDRKAHGIQDEDEKGGGDLTILLQNFSGNLGPVSTNTQ